MANRGISWDATVQIIQDLKDQGSMRLPKMHCDMYASRCSTQTPNSTTSDGGVVLSGIPKHPDFQSHRQWQCREGYVEGVSGHISVRDSEFPSSFWTNPLGRHFGLSKISDMILVELDVSVLVRERSAPPNPAGFLPAHKAIPDAYAACHCHSVHGKEPILIVGQTVGEVTSIFTSMERTCQVQLLAEDAAYGDSVPRKVLISDDEANFNFDIESDPDICHCEV
ncbi:hypothetical protein BDP55DRAFT_755278 [Colletotrichum godetiae]|uniref:Class II aldolase/adducin N-terminal domain-containing protein n=1 Tax=Colletotrichum godetiae TaxID=1209918 RepID=A0AAJ0EQP2_9PEZI|nr:uncharacterized protein BDP55DRAFT_755278 [Colletotrichum godetiae]KAK1659747.1 hypothetical protein BDP55DRAFT_755278 [Colletotrichum godetiae]